MDRYILNTVDYDYKALNHEGFGGVCKYIAAPKRDGLSRLLVKHENVQSACNTFMCSRLAELCGVYTPKAYLMSTSDETRRLFPMHPFIVGTEWVEDFSAVDYGSIKESPALRQQYNERVEILSALECVDYVILYEEDTPYHIISELQPDVLVKGGDYDATSIVGCDIVKKRGGEIQTVEIKHNTSSTKIIERILNQYKGKNNEPE